MGWEAGKEAIFFRLKGKEGTWKQGTPSGIRISGAGKYFLMQIRFCEKPRPAPSGEAFSRSPETKRLKNEV